MASQNAPGVANEAPGYQLPVSVTILPDCWCCCFRHLAFILIFSHCRHYSRHLSKPGRALPIQRVAGYGSPPQAFYLLAGGLRSITALMVALPVSWVQMLAGLALLSTIAKSVSGAYSRSERTQLSHSRHRQRLTPRARIGILGRLAG